MYTAGDNLIWLPRDVSAGSSHVHMYTTKVPPIIVQWIDEKDDDN